MKMPITHCAYKKGLGFVFFALTIIIPIHAQDFYNSYWESNSDVVESENNGEYRHISKIEFTDSQGKEAINHELPYLLNKKYLKVHVTTGKILSVPANIYCGYLDDKLSYGLIDTNNEAVLYDEIVTKFSDLFGAPQKKCVGQGVFDGSGFGPQNRIDSICCLLFEDANHYTNSGGSLLGVFLLTPNSDEGKVKYSYFTTQRSIIFVFENLIPDHITILMIENISHNEGL